MTKYFRCIKDFKMRNGELRHRKGIIYPKNGDEMPCQGESQHSFDERTKGFKKHFQEIEIGSPFVEDISNKLKEANDWRTYYKKMSIELSDKVSKLTQQNLDLAGRCNVLEEESSLWRKIRKKIVD